jgi:branched-subunit amino acid aminotransferase/4-amino-4-deoxychorismate lyase
VVVEVEGRPVDAEELWATASGFGHFTAMQVRGRRTRGLELHLRRLKAANKELFDAGLDGDRVRELVRHALREVEDASVRVYVFEMEDRPVTTVIVKEPGGVKTPQSLLSVRFQRPEAHLKHLATGQGYYTRVAHRSGFDDALLVAPDGQVSETAIANVGFFDGDGVVWPQAPHLSGITMQLLEGVMSSRRAPVHLEDFASYDGVFLSNARGVAAVDRVDDLALAVPDDRLTELAEAYDSVPWDEI